MNGKENSPANGQELTMYDLMDVAGGVRRRTDVGTTSYRCSNPQCNASYMQYPPNGKCRCGYDVVSVS